MRSRIKILLSLCAIFCVYYLSAHNNYNEYVKWSFSIDNDQKPISFNDISIYKNKLSENKLIYKYPIQDAKDLRSISIEVLKESKVLLNDAEGLNERDYKLDAYILKERGQSYLFVEICPFRKNGSIHALKEFNLHYELGNLAVQTRKVSRSRAVQSSILSSGTWYRIAVAEDGVYKIDAEFLDSLGINKEALNPNNIRIYGNRGQMMPEANDRYRETDLVENAIHVEGASDGSFDANDYILFYGDGPDHWRYDEDRGLFDFDLNLYDRYNYYYVNVDLGTGKRVSDQASISGANQTVTAFTDVQAHETENENFIDTGREFWGESFELSTSQDFEFDFPNILSDEYVKIYTRTSGRSVVNGMSFKVNYNSTEVASMSIPMTSISYTSAYARVASDVDSFLANTDIVGLNYKFNRTSSADKGWLDFIVLNARRSLSFMGIQELIFDPNSVGTGNISTFNIAQANSSLKVWEITDLSEIKNQTLSLNGSVASYTLATDSLRTFYMFDGSDYKRPSIVGSVANQDLHGLENIDFVIVAHPEYKSYADQIGNLHVQYDGLSFVTASPQEIYNEFSGGRLDPVAIRDFMKYLYDEAQNNGTRAPQYLLLFGDGTYDPLGHEHADQGSFIPAYESAVSVDPVASYVTDDFYAFLDDDEGGSVSASDAGLLDIGVGRMPIANAQDAQAMVSKVQQYIQGSFGSWKNNITFVADDEDNNIHINDADILANSVISRYPEYNVDKIYFDAYPQENAAGGERYPDVQNAINNKMYSGSFIMNYTGHGGELGWAHERVLNISDIRSWTNLEKLPLFMTATCEFSRYDDPARVSAGEMVLLTEKGGAIGLMTTVRLVYSFANQNIATNFYNIVLEKNQNPSLGDVVRITKNNASGGVNNRKFTLLGDPALKLSYPKHNIVSTSINGKAILESPDTVINGQDTTILNNDTLKALSKVEICGEVQDSSGNKLTSFNGTVYPTILDKSLPISTLENDHTSSERTFYLQKSVIYKGKATVLNGDFCYEFVVPKDISYNIGVGKLSYYADNGTIDASGSFQEVYIGGTASETEEDTDGPEMEIYMNNENFAFGGMTNEDPLLIVKLTDSSGINTVGNSIGHDLSMKLDEDPNRIALNSFYESDLNNYQSGELRYQLNDLETGRHTISVKAWDVYNNSSENNTEFVVSESANIALDHVLNYPNPFMSQTSFWFEHNRPNENLELKIRIYSISGKLVKTIDRTINTEGFLVNDIAWDGKDDFGQDIGNGVYLYSISLETEDGTSSVRKMEKLVLLK